MNTACRGRPAAMCGTAEDGTPSPAAAGLSPTQCASSARYALLSFAMTFGCNAGPFDPAQGCWVSRG
jgi:hypothetical protein